MSPAGYPTRIFTTNRWVTGEVWYKASSVISLIDRFSIDQAYPSLVVNIWVTAMLQLFHPDIEALLGARDKAVADWQKKHPGENVYEDRNLELPSITNVSVERQINKIKKALKAA